MNHIIREYAAKDKNHVLDLVRQNTPLFFAPEEETDFNYYLDNEIDFYYVIEIDEKIVGCGGLNYHPTDMDTLRLSWDVVHPLYQGKGLASTLIEFRIQRVKEIKEVTKLEVRTSQLAYKFYEKHGFVLKDRSQDFWAQGIDMYRMERILLTQ